MKGHLSRTEYDNRELLKYGLYSEGIRGYVNVNIKMLEKWKIIMYVFATLLQPASLSGTVHL